MRLESERLVLRRWRESDLEAIAAIHADLVVARWLGGPVDRAASDAAVARWEAATEQTGFGFLAVERRDDGALVGAAGLVEIGAGYPFSGVEIAWRLARDAWGFGYASEAALGLLADGFSRLGLSEILALTARGNARSRRVMERIGMVHDPARDFLHPLLAPDHPLRAHVLYVASAPRT